MRTGRIHRRQHLGRIVCPVAAALALRVGAEPPMPRDMAQCDCKLRIRQSAVEALHAQTPWFEARPLQRIPIRRRQ
jgi:hypothetical protein